MSPELLVNEYIFDYMELVVAGDFGSFVGTKEL
jgi:hypothetical protein